MQQRRAVRKQLEQRLRERQPEVDALWESFQRELAVAGASSELMQRLERRMTWGLWSVAMLEANAVIDEITQGPPTTETVPSWLCHSCRRRILRVVSREDDGLPAAG